MPEVGRRYYYVEDMADEVMPCPPQLEAWAKWLSQPDPEWPHEIPADGATFKVSTIDVLAIVQMRYANGEWRPDHPAPADATGFVVTDGFGLWDAETWSESLLGHFEVLAGVGETFDEGEEEEIVCTRDGPNLLCRYSAAGPSLVVVGTLQ